jgi:hypothetical protein
MDQKRLEDLGFTVRKNDMGLEVSLDLISGGLLNPLTRKFLTEAVFAAVDDRLVAIEPAELVGLPPISLVGVEKASEVEQQVGDLFNEHVLHLQRRSAELQAIGIEPKVEPNSLQLTAQVEAAGFQVTLAADKRGNFRVFKVHKDGQEVDREVGHALELSEFRERPALSGYLAALLGEPTKAPAATPRPKLLSFHEVLEHFGPGARLPPSSSLEVLVELEVDGQRFRFAAARVAGQTFRGLLAGPQGKLWAERFQLEDFPGPAALLAEALGVPLQEVRLLGTES